MTKLSSTKYSETEEQVRSYKTMRGPLGASNKSWKMTATQKRRALKERPGKPEVVVLPLID